MKISLDGKDVYELTDTQKKVMQNDIHQDNFIDDIERRLKYIIEHKYDQCFKRLVEEWLPKLRERVDAIPTNKDELAKLIFSQVDYLCKKLRDEKDKKEMDDKAKEGVLL